MFFLSKIVIFLDLQFLTSLYYISIEVGLHDNFLYMQGSGPDNPIDLTTGGGSSGGSPGGSPGGGPNNPIDLTSGGASHRSNSGDGPQDGHGFNRSMSSDVIEVHSLNPDEVEKLTKIHTTLSEETKQFLEQNPHFSREYVDLTKLNYHLRAYTTKGVKMPRSGKVMEELIWFKKSKWCELNITNTCPVDPIINRCLTLLKNNKN